MTTRPFFSLVFFATAAASLSVLAGCTTTASGPAGSASSSSSCDVDTTVACNDGTGYSCLDNDTPDQSDSSLFCSDGTPGNAGSTLFCCLKTSSNTSCGSDDTVSCPGGGFGFSCADASEDPNQAYPSLTCSSPTAGNAGSATYCCTD